MEKKTSNFAYKLMVNVGMPIRNLLMPPAKMLDEVDIKPGYKVLDYGCGPGTFTIMLTDKVGQGGIVYALDIHPLAIEMVEEKAQKKKLSNIKTILSSGSTSLPENSIDLIIFFDVFHDLDNQKEVLFELNRILKPDGNMCFSDHHIKEKEIVDCLTEDGLFMLKRKGKRTFDFGKISPIS
ncbi:class I SAM-dependent methyltransferase [Thermodesulfobacteriota bacterium]